MAINSVNDYVASTKQSATFTKVAARTSVATIPFSVIDLAGSPGAGALNPNNTTTGIVPTDADVGYPSLNSFAAGADGCLSRLQFSSSVACRLGLYDRLYVIGALAYNVSLAVSGAPSFAARLPGGSYRTCELWLETVTAFTGSQTVTITYTNELGVAGRTSTLALGVAPTVGRCTQMPLQAGDNGIQSIQNIVSTVSTAGTFNVMILRPLLADGMRINLANGGDTFDFIRTGLKTVFDTSALYLMVTPDSTSTGSPSLTAEIASK